MFKGFKTIVFNILATIWPILEVTDITNVMDMNNEWAAAYVGLVTGVNLWLRSQTTTPVFKASKR